MYWFLHSDILHPRSTPRNSSRTTRQVQWVAEVPEVAEVGRLAEEEKIAEARWKVVPSTISEHTDVCYKQTLIRRASTRPDLFKARISDVFVSRFSRHLAIGAPVKGSEFEHATMAIPKFMESHNPEPH